MDSFPSAGEKRNSLMMISLWGPIESRVKKEGEAKHTCDPFHDPSVISPWMT
jgi:hypothetical protein